MMISPEPNRISEIFRRSLQALPPVITRFMNSGDLPLPGDRVSALLNVFAVLDARDPSTSALS